MLSVPPGLIVSGTLVLVGAVICASLGVSQLLCRVRNGMPPESEGEAGVWVLSLTLVTVFGTVFIHALAQT